MSREMSLYIPRMSASYTEQFVRWVMHAHYIGAVSHVDFDPLIGDEHHKRAHVYFHHYYMEIESNCKMLNAIRGGAYRNISIVSDIMSEMKGVIVENKEVWTLRLNLSFLAPSVDPSKVMDIAKLKDIEKQLDIVEKYEGITSIFNANYTIETIQDLRRRIACLEKFAEGLVSVSAEDIYDEGEDYITLRKDYRFKKYTSK